MTLSEIQKNKELLTDKNSVHNYFCIYEKLFQPIKNEKLNIMELGLHKGHSLILWLEYFKNSNVYGVDWKLFNQRNDNIFKQYLTYENDRLFLYTFNINEVEQFDIFNNIKFDIIIEDADHDLLQQTRTFDQLKSKLNQGGIYIVEDIQSQNLRAWYDKMKKEQKPRYNYVFIDLREYRQSTDNILMIYKNGEKLKL